MRVYLSGAHGALGQLLFGQHIETGGEGGVHLVRDLRAEVRGERCEERDERCEQHQECN
jgi:hypothetical protein